MNFDILWFLLYKIIWDGQRPERQGGSQERGCFKERFIPIQFKRLFKARSLLIKTSSFHKFLLFLVIIRNNLIKLGPRICNDATRKFLFDYWNAKAKQEWSNVRGKNKLDQFSRTRFFTGFENAAIFSLLFSSGEKGRNFKSRKKSCSCNLFLYRFHSSQTYFSMTECRKHHCCHLTFWQTCYNIT